MKTVFNYSSLLLLTLLFFIASALHAANNSPLSAKVSRTHINENETLNLVISFQDARVSEQPDLRGLTTNFNIISQSENSSYQFINGSKKSVKEWHYTLLPTKTGKLFIPTFKLKGYFSDAIVIDVIKSSNNSQSTNADLFIESFTDKQAAFVQEMITLTVRINIAVRIARPELPDLILADFIIKPIGQTDYQKQMNGKNYHVLEYQYALFPSKSGDFTLPKQRYQIAQIISNQRRSFFNVPGFNNTQARFLITPAINLHVKPQPNQSNTHNRSLWLPAKNVNIDDNLSTQQNIEVGTAITRNIIITATNNIAAVIPPLNDLQISSIKYYPEAPVLDNQFSNNQIIGSRTESMALIPTEVGTFTLPEIQIPWWDTARKEYKIATLAARTIVVIPSTQAVSTIEKFGPANDEAALLTPNENQPSQNQFDQVSQQVESNIEKQAWVISTIVFATLWTITLLLALYYFYNRQTKHKPTENNSRPSLRQAKQNLKSACEKQNPVAIRATVLDWGKLFYQDSNIISLQDLIQKTSSDEFKQQLNELDRQLYNTDSHSWNADKLMEIIHRVGKHETKTPAQGSPRQLYPN